MRSSATFIAVIALLLLAVFAFNNNNNVLAQTGAAVSTTTTNAGTTTMPPTTTSMAPMSTTMPPMMSTTTAASSAYFSVQTIVRGCDGIPVDQGTVQPVGSCFKSARGKNESVRVKTCVPGGHVELDIFNVSNCGLSAPSDKAFFQDGVCSATGGDFNMSFVFRCSSATPPSIPIPVPSLTQVRNVYRNASCNGTIISDHTYPIAGSCIQYGYPVPKGFWVRVLHCAPSIGGIVETYSANDCNAASFTGWAAAPNNQCYSDEGTNFPEWTCQGTQVATTTAAPTTTTTAFTCAGSTPATPFTCPDNSCAISASYCACSAGQSRCGTNGNCVANVSDHTQCPCPGNLTSCADGTCASNCTVVCPSATPTRCPDSSCAESIAACPCPPAQWAFAVVTVSISTSSLTSVDVTVGGQVGAGVKAFACGAERLVTVSKNWTIIDLSNSAGSFNVTNAGILTIDNVRFTAGHDYAVTVIAGITYPAVGAGAPKGSATWQFRATQPAPVVTLLGGADFTLLTSTVFSRLALVTRSGVPVNLPITWSCACHFSNTGCLTCPSWVDAALASTTSNSFTYSNTTGIPLGKYVLTASAGGASASQVINVINGAIANPPPVVSIINSPSEAQLLAPGLTNVAFLANIQGDQNGATIAWTLNGNAASSVVTTPNNVLILAKSSFTAGASQTVVITATRGSVSTTASVTFTMPASSVTGTCSVTGSSTPIVGSQTFVTVSSSFSGTSLPLVYGFSEKASGDVFPNPTANSLLPTTSNTYQAPLPKAISGSTTFTVKVDAVDPVSGLTLGTATCTYVVNAPSAAAQERLGAQFVLNIQTATQSGDKSQLAQIGFTLAILAINNASFAASAIEAMNGTLPAPGQLITSATSTAAFNVLSTLANSGSSSGTTTTTTTVPGAPVQVDQAAIKAIDLLVSVTIPANSLDGARQQVNVATNGANILNLISTFAARVGGANAGASVAAKIANATINLARTLAAQTLPGVIASIVAPDGKTQLFGTSVPAGNTSSNVTVSPPGAQGSVVFPPAFLGSLGDSTKTVSIGCAAWSGDAAGANRNIGAPAGGSAASNWTVDYSVAVDGQTQAVSGLSASAAIALSFDVTTESGKVYSCYYFQVTTNTWSNDGLSGNSYSAGKLSCATTHLTQFTVFGSTATSAPGSNGLSTGEIAAATVGSVLGFIFIVVVVILVIRKMEREQEGDGQEGGQTSTTTDDSTPSRNPLAGNRG